MAHVKEQLTIKSMQ